MDDTSGKPWILAINRLLTAEPRLNPRAKPGHPPKLKTWNQTDLAAAAGIGGTTLSHILSGKRMPEWPTLFVLAKALGVEPAVLLMDPQEATDFLTFQQSRAQSRQLESVSETIRRILDERGDAMKAAWIAQNERVLLEAMQEPRSTVTADPKQKQKSRKPAKAKVAVGE